MTSKLKLLTLKKISPFIHHRKGETKFGEKVVTFTDTAPLQEQLEQTEAKFIVLGIAEDIGVQANYGTPGTKNAWQVALPALLNVQYNKYNKAKKVAILGYLDFSEEYTLLENTLLDEAPNVTKLRKIVSEIDKEVTHLVTNIVKAGKIPIVIGGGHNNAYGLLKGCSLALNKAVNAINFDAHSDFRALEGRHSGNGFSYAFNEGFLNKYYMFGLHYNYTSKSLFKEFKNLSDKIAYTCFEDIDLLSSDSFETELQRGLNFVANRPFGIEIDCDAIANIPSSAVSPSGFTVNQARKFVAQCSAQHNAVYLHICEAAPNLDNRLEKQLVGKLIAYLITDFIRYYNDNEV